MILPESYSDVFAFAAPSINATFKAEHPDDIEFVAPAADVETRKRWQFNGLFLTSEHIRVRWFPKGNAPNVPGGSQTFQH